MVGKKLKESNGESANVPDGSQAGGNRDGESILVPCLQCRYNFIIQGPRFLWLPFFFLNSFPPNAPKVTVRNE